MPIVDLVVPQMGEGLQEVLVLRLLKEPGDAVERDEVVYVMETDKADMDVESPHAGKLREWLVTEGSVLPVGAPIARLEVTALSEEPAPDGVRLPAPPRPASRRPAGGRGARPGRDGGPMVPPRTRAYGRKRGLSDDEIRAIPATTGKLMPADVDRYLAARPAVPETAADAPEAPYVDLPLSGPQRIFNFRLKRSAQLVVPATMVRRLSWPQVSGTVERRRRRHPELAFSELEVFGHAVARATRQHPRFRSTLIGDDTVRRHEHVNLGIAVQRPDDELTTAILPRADALDFPDFVATAQRQIGLALEGQDQATEAIQLLLSFVTAYHITEAVPVLVAPATAVVFLGAPFGPEEHREVNLGVTFDHRLIHGVHAAQFLEAICRELEAGSEAEPAAEREAARRRGAAAADWAAALAAAEPGGRRRLLEDALVRETASLLEVETGAVDAREPLRNLGLNSRLALELTRRLGAALDLDLPPTLLWSYPTLRDLAPHLAGELGLPLEPAPADGHRPSRIPSTSAGEDSSLLDEIEDLSDEAAEALLARKLEARRREREEGSPGE